ncbi:unnamed protein product [Boreogadus saida]
MEDLKSIRSAFVGKVGLPALKGLLDDLWQRKMLSTDDKDTVMEDQTNRTDRARCLIDMVMGKGERASQAMIDCMLERDRELYLTLGLILPPSPTDRVGLVQNRSKPVKKKPSCSSGQGSCPGELSPSPPLKKHKSDDTLDTNRGQALSGKQLLQVAETLGQEWGRVGIYLGLTTTDLDDIKAGVADVIMQKLKMLELWQRRTTSEATAQNLLRGLQDLKDLPVKTRQLLRDWINGRLP